MRWCPRPKQPDRASCQLHTPRQLAPTRAASEGRTDSRTATPQTPRVPAFRCGPDAIPHDDALSRCSQSIHGPHRRFPEQPLAVLDRLPTLFQGREVPASALDAHDPEPSLRGVESESPPYGETLQHLVRAEGLLTEHAGRVHGGREPANSEELGEYVPQFVQLFEVPRRRVDANIVHHETRAESVVGIAGMDLCHVRRGIGTSTAWPGRTASMALAISSVRRRT